MKSQGLNGLRTRSRSLLFLIINFFFFPFVDSFCFKWKLPKFICPSGPGTVKWLIWYVWISFNGINLSDLFDLPLQSLVIHKYLLIHFKSVGLPQLSPSLFFLSLFLSLSLLSFVLLFLTPSCFCLWQFNYSIDGHFNLFKAPQLPLFS